MAAEAEKILVTCPCGTRMRAPASAAGRKARCSKCGNILTVPTAGAPQAEQSEDDDLYVLAGTPVQEPVARAAVPSPPPPLAPAAAGAAPAARWVGTVPGSSPAVPPAVQVQTETPPQRQGSFMMGALFSGGLALVGALAWWGIAAITDRELGLIAWGVGLLAGAGMAAGYRNKTAGGGVLAAFMAVAGIVVGKILIFSTIVLPTVLNLSSAGDENDPDVLRDRVEYHLTLKNLEGKGISPDDATDKQWSDAGSAAEERVSQMSEDELARAGRDAKAYQDEENLVSDVAEDLLAQRGAEDEDNFMALTLVEREAREKVKAMTPDERAARLAAIEQEQDAVTEVGGALQVIVVGGVFVVTMFGLMDIVFVLLAIFSAFKVASGATS